MAARERAFAMLVLTPLISGALVVMGVLLTPLVLATALHDLAWQARRRFA